MLDFQELLMRFNRDGFSRTAHEVISMSRDEFPNALCSRGLRFVVSSHLVLFFSRPVFTQLSRFGLMCPSFFLPAVFRSKGKRYKPCAVRSRAALERLMDSR